MKAAIFLDRDGTINRDCPYCSCADEIVMYDDVFGPMRELSKDHYMIVISNQSGLARGYFTRAALREIDCRIMEEVGRGGGRIDAFYYCPHLPDAGCACRKPKTGMLDYAMRDYEIDLRNSFMVGDSDADMEFARRAGIRSIRVRRKGKIAGDFYARDFGRALAIIRREKELGRKVPRVALVLAGGKGTRMRPLTHRIPKPMAKVGGVPIIEHIIRNLAENGIREVFISVGYKAQVIMRHLGSGKRLGVMIEYVREKRPLGTGGGLKLGLRSIMKRYGKTDVFVSNGDDLFDLPITRMYRQHLGSRAVATLALHKARSVYGSGVAVLRGKRIRRFLEKPQMGRKIGNLVNLGKYIVNTDILELFPKKNAFSFEREFMEDPPKGAIICGYVAKGRWYQINTVEALRKAQEGWNK